MGPTDKAIWDQEIPVPEKTISYVDPAIAKSNLKIKGIFPSGASYWARTAKVVAFDKGDNEDSYFIKVHQGEVGKTMVSSEYEAMMTLYKLIPEMVARPVGWASFEEIPDTYFYMCKYHKMNDENPDIKVLPALVAEFHRRSASPSAKFGYPNPTFGGRNPQYFPPSDTWVECFKRGMEGIFAAELATQGPDEDWERLTRLTLDKTIPRLLGALEANGRSIVPTLVHGDLWEGNCSVDAATGAPMIFDGTPLYAHNEYELGPWLCPRHSFPPYIDEYLKHFPASAPVEEFGDRIELYCLRFDVHASSLYKGNLRFRSLARETMEKLLGKYRLDG